MFEWMHQPEAWIALLTLTSLEIVLGIDNIIFISILVGRLPEDQRQKGRIFGLTLAMVSRIVLLMALAWIMRLTQPLFEFLGMAFSGRELILIGGGLFLIAKSTHEIHAALEVDETAKQPQTKAQFMSIMIQIAILDIVFSLDSVITAVGMAKHLPVMIIAVVLAVIVMMLASKRIGDFVDNHPTIKMLALSFLILVGVALMGEGFEMHIPKGYIYFAMFFSFAVEMLNISIRNKSKKKVKLKKPIQ